MIFILEELTMSSQRVKNTKLMFIRFTKKIVSFAVKTVTNYGL